MVLSNGPQINCYVPKTSSNHQIKNGSILKTDFRLFFDRVETDSRSFGFNRIGPKIVLITSAIRMTLRIVINELGLELRSSVWGYFEQIYLFRWPSTASWLKVMYRGLSFVPTLRAHLTEAWITTTCHEWDFLWALTWFINSLFPFLRSWSINAPKCDHHQAND